MKHWGSVTVLSVPPTQFVSGCQKALAPNEEARKLCLEKRFCLGAMVEDFSRAMDSCGGIVVEAVTPYEALLELLVAGFTPVGTSVQSTSVLSFSATETL